VLLAAGRTVAAGPPAEVLTEENLARYYRARVRVLPGAHGPLVVPVRDRDVPGTDRPVPRPEPSVAGDPDHREEGPLRVVEHGEPAVRQVGGRD